MVIPLLHKTSLSKWVAMVNHNMGNPYLNQFNNNNNRLLCKWLNPLNNSHLSRILVIDMVDMECLLKYLTPRMPCPHPRMSWRKWVLQAPYPRCHQLTDRTYQACHPPAASLMIAVFCSMVCFHYVCYIPFVLIFFAVKALYDYTATIEEEFDFQAGDIIAVLATPDDGWWQGVLLDDSRRQPGRTVFPSNFVCLF
jgi:hypothetical protein